MISSTIAKLVHVQTTGLGTLYRMIGIRQLPAALEEFR